MARDVLEVWNQALGHVGVRIGVQSVTEGTREAQHLASVWPLARDSALEAYWWNFTTAYRTLAELSEDAPASWIYSYQRPSDCLLFRYIEAPARATDSPIVYELGTDSNGKRTIWTDHEGAVGCYNRLVTDPNLWSAQFCNALAWKLAVSLAMTEIGSPRDATQMEQIYLVELEKASVLDANEEQRDPHRDAEGIRERE